MIKMAHICDMFRKKCRLSRVRHGVGMIMSSNESFFSSLIHQRQLSTTSTIEISESSSLRKRANSLSRVRGRHGVGMIMSSNESFSSLRHQRKLSTTSTLEISESSALRKRANNNESFSSLCRRHQRKLSTISTLEISKSSALRKRDFSTTQLKTINTSPLKTIVLTGFLGSGKSCLEHRVSNSRSIMPFSLNQGRRRC